MLFNSVEYLFFLGIVCVLYFIINYKYRWALLLITSYLFYGSWNAEYLLLLWSITLLSYFFAKVLVKQKKTPVHNKMILAIGILSILSFLLVFKYTSFILQSINEITASTFSIGRLILPVGISFFTFQAISYIIDTYRDKRKIENHLGKYALYISFFPQLVAGPIEKANQLIPQFSKNIKFNTKRTYSGVILIIWGLFKKVVIADRLAIYVNTVYSNHMDYNSFVLILATLLFSIQIYTDFSGYSDIAIGSARILGIDLMKNFNMPYFADSVKDFWNRWHISLMTWLKDYIYIPLGGNRKGTFRKLINILIVFFISGLWHGAGWTFILWGLLNGIFLNLEASISSFLTHRHKIHLPNIIHKYILPLFHIAITTAIIDFTWIFFRAKNLSTALSIIRQILHFDFTIGNVYKPFITYGAYELKLSLLAIVIMVSIEYLTRTTDAGRYLSKKNPYLVVAALTLLVMFMLSFGIFGTPEFIYFQF